MTALHVRLFVYGWFLGATVAVQVTAEAAGVQRPPVVHLLTLVVVVVVVGDWRRSKTGFWPALNPWGADAGGRAEGRPQASVTRIEDVPQEEFEDG